MTDLPYPVPGSPEFAAASRAEKYRALYRWRFTDSPAAKKDAEERRQLFEDMLFAPPTEEELRNLPP